MKIYDHNGKDLIYINLKPDFNDFTQEVTYQEIRQTINKLKRKDKNNLRCLLNGMLKYINV
jgi:hypothetical protein